MDTVARLTVFKVHMYPFLPDWIMIKHYRSTRTRLRRMGWPDPPDLVEQYNKLARLACDSDSPEGLVIAASRQLRRTLALLAPSGAALAVAPQSAGSDPPVDDVLAAARANAHEPSNGWRVRPVERDGKRLALVAARDDGPWEADQEALLDLVVVLLADQLDRASLASAVRSGRRAALVRRLVTDHTITPGEIRSEARNAGLRLADFYWPALLVWAIGHPGPRTLVELDGEAQRQVPGSLMIALDSATVALLLPARRAGAAEGVEVQRRLAVLVRHARQLGHRDVRGLAGVRSVEAARLPSSVTELARRRRYLPLAAFEAPVVSAQSFALYGLLSEGLDRQRAQAFVHERLGPLLRHDRDHRTDLASVLESALDTPRRDQAARACYMHRNTFRRRLSQALELVDTDLENPAERLALHLALKLRRLMEGPDPAFAPR